MDVNKKKFESFRELFPAYSQGVYMNHAAVSPFSTLTRDTLMDFWERRSHIPVDVYPQIAGELKEFKELIAQLINAGNFEDIAFVPNTSTGLAMITTGLQWNKGDRIILNTMEFPSNIYPFMNMEQFGVEMDFVEPRNGRVTLEAIREKITPQTRMAAISFVQFLNGYKADLEAIGELCKKHGIWFIVDGIQGVGVVPLDVQKYHIHALSNGGHKWLMWPMGTAFLYIHPRLLEKLRPAHAGWLSVKDSWNLFDYQLDFLDTASRFQPGTLNFMGLLPAKKILQKFLELGIDHIYQRLLQVTGALIDGFKELGVEIVTPPDQNERSGIVSIKVNEPDTVLKQLEARNIYPTVREGIMRFSPHCANNLEDVEKVISALKEILS